MQWFAALWKRFEHSVVGRSIFRVGLPVSNLQRAQAMMSSFFLHLHPAKVHSRSLQPSATFGLGLISLYLFLILTVSGVMLMFYYVPSTQQAYDDMKDLEFAVTAGQLLRNVHRWAAHMMVVAVFLHMCRVFYTGAYKLPREFNWLLGIALLLLTLFLSFTGYLLPWDQLAYWAVTVGANIASYAPIVGDRVRFILLGGTTVGQSALTRFYALHVMVLPLAATGLIAVHLWRVRKDGGLARPDEAPTIMTEEFTPGMLPTSKTYGLMELARGHTPVVGVRPEDEVFSWPHLVFRELLVGMGTVAAVLLLAILFDAPLEETANPVRPPNPAKAPWYFLGLQELVSYSAFWGGVVVPTVLVVTLVLLPYLDRRPVGVGVWFARERRLVTVIFTLCVVGVIVFTAIGSLFRGPNWALQWPWESPLTAHH